MSLAYDLNTITESLLTTVFGSEFKIAGAEHRYYYYFIYRPTDYSDTVTKTFDRFWWNLAQWRTLAPYCGSTVKIFLKIQDGTGGHLENHKIALSPQRFDRSLRNLVWWCKKGVSAALTVRKFEFQKIRMAEGRHFRIIIKSPYLCNRLTDFNTIWHNDAYWSPAPDVKFKFLIFDDLISYNAENRYLENRKTA